MREQWWAVIREARWFGGKGLAAELVDLAPLPWFVAPGDGPGVRSEIATVRYDSGRTEFYHLLVGYLPQTEGALASVEVAGVGLRGVVDATANSPAMKALLSALVLGQPAIDWLDAAAVDPGAPTSVWAGEQSNTTVCVGRDVLFKVFRKLEPGRNLDVEVLAALSGSGDTPALYGTLVGGLPDGSGQADLGMFVQRVGGVTDGWQWASRACAEDRDIRSEAAQLGRALRRVHLRLADAFGTGVAAGDATSARMIQRLDEAIAQAAELAGYRDSLRLSLLGLAGQELATQRVHGDFHLGQVLRSATGWTIIDFEGEPLKPLAERRQFDSVWRDVAGMLRSFDYVRGAHPVSASDQARAWSSAAQQAFLDGYCEGSRPDPAVLSAYLVDKAVYEVVYEVRNRPNWAHIPLGAVHDEARRAALRQPRHQQEEH